MADYHIREAGGLLDFLRCFQQIGDVTCLLSSHTSITISVKFMTVSLA